MSRKCGLFATGLLLVLFLSTPVLFGQPDGVSVQRRGLIFGNNDLTAVDEAWLNLNPRYRKIVDAVGYFLPSACTASYVGGGLAVTAGHCVGAGASVIRNRPCNSNIQWGRRVGIAPYLVSQCRRILAAKNLEPYDYAILEIWPLPHAEIRAVHNAGSGTRVTAPATMFGHPAYRNLEWSGTCHVPPYGSGFAHRCDSEGGSSGSLMLENSTLNAIGIHYGHSFGSNSGIFLGHTPLGDLMDLRFKPKGRIVGSSGKCLDVKGSSSADRTPVQLWNCTNSAAQRWTLTPYNNLVAMSGKCLDTPYETNGTGTWLFTCHYGENQRWRMENVEFRSKNSKCLDVPGNAPDNSTRAQIWNCHGGNGQKWTITADQEIRSSLGKCLDVESHNPRNGTRVVVYDCHGGANQKWDITKDGRLQGIGGYCLDVPGGRFDNGAPLQVYDCNGSNAQRWFVRGEIRGLGNKCLNSRLGSVRNGTPVEIQECTGVSSQLWDYHP